VSNGLRADGGISSNLKQQGGLGGAARVFLAGDSNMEAKVETKVEKKVQAIAETIVETIVLILGLGMVAPLPFEEIVGDYGRLALAVIGFLLIFWWLFNNDRKKDLRGEL
jgi:hypothetical protein